MRVYFTRRAREQMADRGTSKQEVLATLSGGKGAPAKVGRLETSIRRGRS